MARSLVVWGHDSQDWSQEKDVMTRHGFMKEIEHYQDGDKAWCVLCFSTLTAAKACMADLKRCFGNLKMCLEPNWQTFGKGATTALADLIRLAEWLGCRENLHVPPRPKAVCLARGADAILAALEAAGGPSLLAKADQAAAVCLCRALMQFQGGVYGRVVNAFAEMGPRLLRATAAEIQGGAPALMEHIAAAGCLGDAFQQTRDMSRLRHKSDHRLVAPWLATVAQVMAPDCLRLLHAIVDASFVWSAAVSRPMQQQQSCPDSTPRTAQPPNEAPELRKTATWLPAAACNLLVCIRRQLVCSAIDQQQLLDTLGQLLQRVVACMELAESAHTAAWLPESFSSSAAACVGQLHFNILLVVKDMDQAACDAVGLPALQAAIIKTVTAALDHLATPQHLGLLLYLSLLLQTVTQIGSPDNKQVFTVMTQLTRMLHLTATWLSAAQDVPSGKPAESLPGLDKLLSSADQLALLVDYAAHLLAETVAGAPCNNMRYLSKELVSQIASSCLAPGLFHAARALLKAQQYAEAAAAAGRPWAANAIAALVRGGIGGFRLAHAEAAAQEGLPAAVAGNQQPDRLLSLKMRLIAAKILNGAADGLTPPVARTLARQGLVAPLLQATPWKATSSEVGCDASSWETTLLGTMAVVQIIAVMVAADAPACTAALQNGSWGAALDRLRDLQPPPALARDWSELREMLIQTLADVRGCCSTGTCRTAGGHTSAADADAIAAADRAMQELLAEEEAADGASQRSKAAAKRARKKAAKQRAAAIEAHGQLPDATGQPAAATPSSDAAAVDDGLRTPTMDTPRPKADSPGQDAACGMPTSPDAGLLPLQQPEETAAHPAAQSEWWRCPLSGRVMRDPVLCGAEGHSFERGALQAWLAANPGVDPLSRQPLAPGGGNIVPNHALRNLIQQLQEG